MALAAEGNPTAVDRSHSETEVRTSTASLVARTIAALGLTAIAGNCFLRYLWWAANASAWQGIPKHAEQWRTAAARTSFYGWSLLLLEVASVVLLFGLFGFRSLDSSNRFRNAVRLGAALIITVITTALFALVLSWINQGT